MSEKKHKGLRKIHKAIKFDDKLIDAMVDLRSFVDNLNKTPDIAYRNGTYKKINQDDVFTVKAHGFLIGYKLKEHLTHVTKTIYIETTDNTKFSEIPEEESGKLLSSVCEVFLEVGEGTPEINLSNDGKCFMLTHDFAPLYLTRKSDLESINDKTIH